MWHGNAEDSKQRMKKVQTTLPTVGASSQASGPQAALDRPEAVFQRLSRHKPEPTTGVWSDREHKPSLWTTLPVRSRGAIDSAMLCALRHDVTQVAWKWDLTWRRFGEGQRKTVAGSRLMLRHRSLRAPGQPSTLASAGARKNDHCQGYASKDWSRTSFHPSNMSRWIGRHVQLALEFAELRATKTMVEPAIFTACWQSWSRASPSPSIEAQMRVTSGDLTRQEHAEEPLQPPMQLACRSGPCPRSRPYYFLAQRLECNIAA